MNGSNLEFVDKLEAEFVRIANAHARRPRRLRRSATAALAALAVCFSGGVALALSGAFDDGDVTASLGNAHGERAVVMTGKDSTGAPWQLLAAKQDGAFCLSLRSGPSRGGDPRASAQCGGLTPGRLELTTSGEGGPRRAFGTLPDEAVTVVLAGAGASSTATVGDDRRDLPGKFYVVEVPAVDESQLMVSVEDASGRTIASGEFQQLLGESSPF